MRNRRLLRANLQIAPQQPATAFFRAVELDHVLQSKVLPLTGHALDLGCGDGQITRLLAHETGARWTLVGLDFDPHETELARQSGVYQRVHTSGAENIQEPDNCFDFVFSNSVLEHIPDLTPVLAEVWRILKPGGRFVFTVPSFYFPEFLGGPNWLGRFATRQSERGAYLRAIDERLAHFRYWDQNTWRQSLSGVGLQLDHTSHYLTRPELQRWESMSNATSGALVRLIGKRPIEIRRQIRYGNIELARQFIQACFNGVAPDAINVRDALAVLQMQHDILKPTGLGHD